MNVKTSIRRKTALGCIAIILPLALLGNPFIPDVCASRGYGYPFPFYISWCECFIEGYPSPIDAGYVLFDSLFWVGIWWASSSALYRKAQKQSAQRDSIKP
jgi:hypothetical protein